MPQFEIVPRLPIVRERPFRDHDPGACRREQTMAEEAVQKTRQLGSRQLAIRAIDRALSEFLPEHLRTSAERSLVHGIHSLTRNVHLNAAELRIVEHVVHDIKAVVTERSMTKGC